MDKPFNIGLRKVGGIWFWNVGRIGGSFFISSRAAYAAKQHKIVSDKLVTQAIAFERQWQPYGWTPEGFQHHMDTVAYYEIAETIYR